MKIKQWLKSKIPPAYIFKMLHLKKSIPFIGGIFEKSYSGNGEDIILVNYLFKNFKNGFYVDVGSFHPKIISNTYKLHKKGWHGINIDPNPDTIKLFKKFRNNDTNLRIGISEKRETLDYYNFSYSGANTFDEEFAKNKLSKEWNTLISKDKVDCFPLSEILDKHLKGRTEIDLLDIDVEGMDLRVLQSNDWSKYRPSVILVEDKKFRSELNESEIFKFLISKHYKFHSYMDITLIMIEENFKRKS